MDVRCKLLEIIARFCCCLFFIFFLLCDSCDKRETHIVLTFIKIVILYPPELSSFTRDDMAPVILSAADNRSFLKFFILKAEPDG